MRSAVEEYFEHINRKGAKDTVSGLLADAKKTGDATALQGRLTDAHFFRTVAMARLDNEHPEAIDSILAAEFSSAKTLHFIAFLKLVSAEPRKALEIKNYGKRLITPLIEYAKDIGETALVLLEAFENKHFLESQRVLRDPNDPRLATYDPNVPTVGKVMGKLSQHEKKWLDRFGAEYPGINEIPLLPLRQMKVRDLVANIRDPEQRTAVKKAIWNKCGGTKKKYKEALDMDVFRFVVMYAGSDSYKSGSSGIYSLICKGVDEGTATLAVFGTMMEKFLAPGTGIGRLGIADSIITTANQGRGKRRSTDSIHARQESLAARHMERHINTFREEGDKLNIGLGRYRDPRAQAAVAVANISNTAGLRDHHDEDDALWAARDEAMLKSYVAEYGSHADDPPPNNPLRAFMEHCTPRALIKAMQTSSRSPQRVGKEKQYHHLDERAIGFGGANANQQGGMRQLLPYIKGYIGADENGNFSSEELERATTRFLNDWTVQHKVSAALWSATSVNLERPWRYTQAGLRLNGDIRRGIQDDGSVRIYFGEKDEAGTDLKELAAGNVNMDLITPLLARDSKIPLEDVKLAIQHAAERDFSNHTAIKALTALLASVESEAYGEPLRLPLQTGPGDPEALRTVLARLNHTTGLEIAMEQESLNWAYDVFEKTFADMKKNGFEVTKDPKFYDVWAAGEILLSRHEDSYVAQKHPAASLVDHFRHIKAKLVDSVKKTEIELC